MVIIIIYILHPCTRLLHHSSWSCCSDINLVPACLLKTWEWPMDKDNLIAFTQAYWGKTQVPGLGFINQSATIV